MLVVESSIESPGEREITFRARVDGDGIDSEKRVTLLNEGRRYPLSVPVGTADEPSVVLEAGDETIHFCTGGELLFKECQGEGD